MDRRAAFAALAWVVALASAGTTPEGVDFLARNAQKDDVHTTDTGLQRGAGAAASPSARRARRAAAAAAPSPTGRRVLGTRSSSSATASSTRSRRRAP